MPSSNPLWFGYYPGDRPIPKRPDQRFPTPQVDMSDMGLNAVLDEAMNVAGKPAEMPKQLWEWVQGDWKFQFNIASSPYQQKGDELYAYDPSEVTDVPGAYVQINVVDLVKDPKKTASKFIEKSMNTLNPLHGLLTAEGEFWTDLDTSREKAMWRELLRYDPASPTPDPYTMGIVRKAFTDSAGNPISLHNIGVMKGGKVQLSVGAMTPAGGLVTTGAGVAETDVYEGVAGSVMGFVSGKKSAFSRTGAYSGMQASFIDAAAVELSQNRTSIRTALAGSPILPAVDSKIDSLVRENELIDKLNKFNKNGAKDGLANIRADLAQVGFTQAVPTASIQAKLTSLEGKINDPTNGMRAQINSIRAGLAGPELARFNADVKEIEGVLSDTLAICTKYTNPSITALSRAESERLLQELTGVSSRFSNNRYSGGAYDRFLQSVSGRYFDGTDSLLTFNPLDAGGNQIMSDGYRSMNTLYRYQKRIYLQEDGRDLLNAIFSDKGDLEKTYVWFGQVRDRIQMFTPGYWTGKVMDRTHGLGLVYKGDDVVPLHPIFNRNPLIQKHTFTENFNVTLGAVSTKVSGKFEGGEHLQHFYKAWKRAEDGKLVGVGVGTGVTYSANPLHHTQALFDAINGNVTNVSTLGAGMNYVTGSADDMTGMVTDWNKFRTALQTSGLPFQFDGAGNLINNAHNKALLDGTFKRIGIRKINSANIDPFVSRIGALQIYASKLSLQQQKIFSKVGKFIDPWVHLRTATAKKIGDFAGRIISKLALRAGLTALGAAMAGIATVLAPIIEKVMQAVVSRVIDKSKALVRAVLKGDFSGELDKMMNDAMKATEKVITCGCFVPMFLVFAIFMMMANIIVSISPTYRSKSTASSASAGGTPFTTPPPVASGVNCPLQGASLTLGSYTVGGGYANAAGHGSRYYWEEIFGGGTNSLFSIPYLGSPRGFTCPGGYCSPNDPAPYETENPMNMPGAPSKALNSTPYYGYAADFASGNHNVNAPGRISCGGTDTTVTSWQVTGTVPTSYGCGIVMSSTPARYRIFLLHLNTCGGGGCSCYSGKTYNAGDGITTLWSTNPHVHIEFTDAGTPQRPESCLCR